MISTPLDTYGTAVKISHMEVKINVQTLGKAKRAVELVNEYVDLEKISKFYNPCPLNCHRV